MPGPLDGIRILDLTSNFMGPYASLLLADMGADVVKVESPAGDTTRGVGPARHSGMGAIFLHLNRNKRSIVMDLATAAAAAALRRMVETTDVVIYSLRPKSMARLGLSYEDVRELNSRAVYAGAFGFGQGGPYADRPAYDDLIQAAVGMPVLQSRKIGEPEYVATAFADRVVGMALCTAVAMALYERERSGLGQEVQVPMFETFAHFVMGDHLYGHTFIPSIGDSGYARMMNPDRKPYRTLDGYLSINVYIDRHWHTFFELSGHPEMSDDPRFKDIAGRTENIALLYRFLADIIATRTTAEWLDVLLKADIPAIEMNTPETLILDEHMRDVNFFVKEMHPTEGELRSLGIAQTWSRTSPEIRLHAPRLGEHTTEVLTDYGFDAAEVKQLLVEGAVREAT